MEKKNNELSDKRRLEVQNEGKNRIMNSGFNGIALVAPRVGKTKMMLDSLEGSSAEIFVSSPYDVIRKNWLAEHAKWGSTSAIKSICHSSLKKIPEGLPLLIVDEIHTLSPAQIRTIQQKKPQRIMGLTGFMSQYTQKGLRWNLGLNPIFEYGIEQAITDGIISSFDVTVLKCPMNDTNRYVEVFDFSSSRKYWLTERNAYEYYTEIFEANRSKLLTDPTDADAAKWKEIYARKRQHLIYKSPYKLRFANSITDEALKEQRVITFAGNIEISGKLNDHYAYHSKNKKEENLKKFIAGEIDKCAVINMANMGITIPNLKIAIIQQAQSTAETSVQRILRVCNLEDMKKAHIFILAFSNTVEEGWVNDSLEGISPHRVETYDFADYDSCNRKVKEILGRES